MFASDSATAAIAYEGGITVISLPAMEEINFLISEEEQFLDWGTFALSPNGKLLALGSGWDMDVHIYRAADSAIYLKLNVNPFARLGRAGLHSPVAMPLPRSGPGANRITDLAFSPDGARLAVGTGHHSIHMIDLTTGEEQWMRALAEGSLRFSPDSQTLVCKGSSAAFLAVEDGAFLHRLANHPSNLNDFDVSPDGRFVAAGGGDGRIWLRSTAAGGVQRIYAVYSRFRCA